MIIGPFVDFLARLIIFLPFFHDLEPWTVYCRPDVHAEPRPAQYGSGQRQSMASCATPEQGHRSSDPPAGPQSAGRVQQGPGEALDYFHGPAQS